MCDTAEHHAYAASFPDYSWNATNVGPSLVGQSNPLNPSNSFGFYGDLWAEGNLVAIGTQQGTGVAIVDISNPANPTFQSYYNPSPTSATGGGKFKDVVIRNKIGYFAIDNNGETASKGIHIVDLSNPTNPQLISRISGNDAFQHNHNIFIDGNYLYASPNDRPRVRVYDISNPAAPSFVREFATTGTTGQNMHDLTVRNGKLYTSNTDNGFTDVYNVANVASPSWTATTNRIASFNVGPRNHSNDVTADGNYVICCRETQDGDCQVWSMMTPGAPVKVATLNADTIGVDAYSPHNPVIVGDKLYISWYQAGVQIFDFADPSNPMHLGGYDTFPGGADVPGQHLDAFGGNWGVYPFMGPDKLLLSDMERGLFVLDASATVPETGSIALIVLSSALIAARRRRLAR